MLLLGALERAVQRRYSAAKLLEIIRDAGWAIVPRTAPADGETWDLVRTAAISAAYRSDDVFQVCYAAVVAQAERELALRLSIMHRLGEEPAAQPAPAEEEADHAF